MCWYYPAFNLKDFSIHEKIVLFKAIFRKRDKKDKAIENERKQQQK